MKRCETTQSCRHNSLWGGGEGGESAGNAIEGKL